MHRFLVHHLDLVAGAASMVVAGLVTYACGRRWYVLLPVPAALAGIAWSGWEFSAEAAPFAVAVAVLGYTGIGLGVGLGTAAGRRRA